MNKKGFTLIELLAVIVILGIITLIAIPSVSNIIKNSKERVALTNAKTFLSEVEKYALKHDLDSGTYTFDLKGKTLKISQPNADSYPSLNEIVNIKGTSPGKGTVTIDSKGNVTNAEMYYSSIDKNVLYSLENGYKIQTPKVVLNDGTTVYFNPVTNKACSESDYNNNTTVVDDVVKDASSVGYKTGCMKWYAFLDSKESTTTKLLLDHNTTLKVASTPTAISEDLALLNDIWKVTPRLISAMEVAQITGADKKINWTVTKIYTNGFYLDGASGEDDTWKTRVASSTVKSKYAWLYDRTFACELYGCNISDNANNRYYQQPLNGNNSTWMAHYYTSDGGDGYYRNWYWGVTNDGALASSLVAANAASADGAIRPVIEVSSSLISK